jgi:carboxymethylenebutenolidase
MGSWINAKRADGGSVRVYRAPAQGTAKGSVVIVQEIFGVNEHIRNVCDRFAAQGYTALAPAVFDRVEPNVELGYDQAGIEKGREIMAKVGMEPALADIVAAVGAVTGGKPAVIGYCWGGTLAYAATTRFGDKLSCAVSYYGGGVGNMLGEKPKCPVMFHFGKRDQSIPLDVVDKVRAALPDAPLHVYDAGHGFSCDARGSFDAESAKLALERTLGFLAAHGG